MRKESQKKPYRRHLFICHGKSCSEKGKPEEAKAFFKKKIKERGLATEVRACSCSCLDHCDFGPNMVVYPEGVWYSGVQQSDWEEIFERHIVNGEPVKRLRSDQT